MTGSVSHLLPSRLPPLHASWRSLPRVHQALNVSCLARWAFATRLVVTSRWQAPGAHDKHCHQGVSHVDSSSRPSTNSPRTRVATFREQLLMRDSSASMGGSVIVRAVDRTRLNRGHGSPASAICGRVCVCVSGAQDASEARVFGASGDQLRREGGHGLEQTRLSQSPRRAVYASTLF